MEEAIPCKFYSEGRCRFGDRCRNLHDGEKQVSLQPQKQEKKIKQKLKGGEFIDDSANSKLPSMKTARDVIQRIIWDTDVPSEHITIGYLDRFVGVVERPFDMFDWTSDLASVDNQNVLAIPQHRIQYFKYRGKKLWDKNERLDLVFGSTSSTETNLPDLMQSIDEDLLFQEETLTVLQDLHMTVDDQDQKPTHFLAIRLDDLSLTSSLADAVNKISGSPTQPGAVSPDLYHCTLILLVLDSVDQIAHCTSVLKSIGPEFFQNSSVSLELKGLATFRGRVLYSRIRPSIKLDTMVYSIISFLKDNNIRVLERPNEYHVSLVKGHKFVKGLDLEKLPDLEEQVFGHQTVEFIHLCALREAPDVDGFYRIVTSVNVSN